MIFKVFKTIYYLCIPIIATTGWLYLVYLIISAAIRS